MAPESFRTTETKSFLQRMIVFIATYNVVSSTCQVLLMVQCQKDEIPWSITMKIYND